MTSFRRVILAACMFGGVFLAACDSRAGSAASATVPCNQQSKPMNDFLKIAVAFILGFATAVLAEPFRRWLFRSAISPTFKPKIGFGRQCVCLSTTSHPDVMAKYIRVLVECSSWLGVTAQGCRPFLTRIERLEPEYKELHHDPIPLNWAYVGHQALDIHRGMKFYFDVVAVKSDDNRLQPQTTVVPETWVPLLSRPGKYRFTVIVSGQNVQPKECKKVTFQWNGQFDSLTEDCFSD